MTCFFFYYLNIVVALKQTRPLEQQRARAKAARVWQRPPTNVFCSKSSNHVVFFLVIFFPHSICAASESTQESCYGSAFSDHVYARLTRVWMCSLSFFFFLSMWTVNVTRHFPCSEWATGKCSQSGGSSRFTSRLPDLPLCLHDTAVKCGHQRAPFVFLRGYYDMMWPIPEITLHALVGFSIFALGFYPKQKKSSNLHRH